MKYTNIVERNIDYKIQEFDSISDLTQHIEQSPLGKFFKNNYLDSNTNDSKFSGTSSYDEALNLLRTGWNVTAEKLALSVPIKPQTSHTSTYHRPTYSSVGFQASVPRYLQGIPTNMIDRKPTIIKQKIITLNKFLTFSAKYSKDTIEKEGIKALQIIQLIESKGYRVKLNIVHSASMKKPRTGLEVIVAKICIKKPEERLSLSKVAFPIAHPSMLRRIMLRWTEKFTEVETNFSFGYGYPAIDEYVSIMPKGEYAIPHKIDNIENFVKNILK